ncbi:hypothetical protein BDP27DRAFT_1428149 [Rhodocollybia butyracea]|uniref:Uncharacterized protein n=1 Tax=Rhodocollybia butyracea TaxID=206335 RepID=A0A9P5PHL8_9AGAR|nr:hypothetical protein BDP27DRAFT_1428149 [Rhodocollybia butyracea]
MPVDTLEPSPTVAINLTLNLPPHLFSPGAAINLDVTHIEGPSDVLSNMIPDSRPIKFPCREDWERYHCSVLDAISRQSNPRNIEAFHKAAYRNAYLSLLLSDSANADVLEEMPINSKESEQALEALHRTVSASRRNSKILTPDIMIRMFAVVGQGIYRDTVALHELKKAVSRRTTDLVGVPLTDSSVTAILKSIARATLQVEAQAQLLFLSTSKYPFPQQELLLIASAGRWFTVKVVHRDGMSTGSVQSVVDKLCALEAEETDDELKRKNGKDTVENRCNEHRGRVQPLLVFPECNPYQRE